MPLDISRILLCLQGPLSGPEDAQQDVLARLRRGALLAMPTDGCRVLVELGQGESAAAHQIIGDATDLERDLEPAPDGHLEHVLAQATHAQCPEVGCGLGCQLGLK